MRTYIVHKLLILIFLLLSATAQGVRLTGKITDERGEPLPFVNVYLTGTSTGTTANINGIYTLELKPGYYKVSYRLVGYKMEQRDIQLGEADKVVDVRMSNETFDLKEVNVSADREDPAYAIIRKAQKKRKFYKEKINSFYCNAYVKSTQKLVSYPKKLFGNDVNLSNVIDSISGIFYLSESVSNLYFEQPDIYKEKMISSRVSGSARTYSFNQAPDVLIDLHDNLVKINQLVPRGIVSPIASDALFFYDYRFERSFIENGLTINQISVIPKRKNDPVFKGTVYITDDSWRLYSADLFITKNQQMEFLDTFDIKQNFIPLENDVWLPFSHQMYYSFNIFGFKGNGLVTGVFSDFDLSPVKKDYFSRGEIFKIEKGANKKDSVYWSATRPIPLTSEEVSDYKKKDSIRVIRESKPYQDSVDHVNNKFKSNALLTSYTYTNTYKGVSLFIGSPVQEIFYNTVEGWNTRMTMKYQRTFGDTSLKRWSISPMLRYGFSNRHFNGHVVYENLYDPHKLAVLTIDAGTAVSQYNSANPISDMTNTVYCLWGEKNFMKLYEKRFLSVNHKSELANGIGFGITAEYAHRLPMSNTSDYKFTDVRNRIYETNHPLNPTIDTPFFKSHNAFILDAVLAIKPGMQYANRPEGKFNMGTKYPVLRLYYTKGLKALGSIVDFDMYKISLSDEFSLGLLGKFAYKVMYGDFIRTSTVYLQDYKHFNGNRTFFSQFRMDDFRNLEYYRFSTTDEFLEGHAEYNLGGFLLNKIPLIRKLKLQEVVTLHVLDTRVTRLVELTAGVEKLNLIRAELVTTFTEGKRGAIGFVFGIKRTFGL